MSAATTQKYFSVARMEGVAFSASSGSRCGTSLGSSSALCALHGEIPDHGPDAGQQHHEADHRPDDDGAGGAIINQRLGRPVLGVGDRAAGPLGAAGPGRPEEEARSSAAAAPGS